jgi:hypothetical protein
MVKLCLKDGGVAEREGLLAQVHGAEAALAHLEELTGEDWFNADTTERVLAKLN